MRKLEIMKISNLVSKYNLGNTLDLEILNSSQNTVYKVTTDKGIYVIKEYSKDAISNYYYLKKRKEQIRISEILNDNNIKTIIPISYNNRRFIFYEDNYYLIYNYVTDKVRDSNEIDINNIKTLALIQSKIHKLNIKTSLPCSYKYIDIDLDKQLRIAYKVNKELYKKLDSFKNELSMIIDNCNKYYKKMRNNLCVSHNDYKLLNILWNDDTPILIDFDATGLANPTCCLCESAFTFSNYKSYINYDFYYEYLKSYLSNYGKINEDFMEAMYVSFNGKLQWLKYMFSKNHLKKNNYIDGTISMIDELMLYYYNIDKFNDIYKKIINELK